MNSSLSKEDIGITVSKEADFSEWYTQVVLKAKLADYAPVKGLIVLRPEGYSIWESLRNTFDEKFSKNGIRNGFLPILIPESLLGKEQKHFAGFNPLVNRAVYGLVALGARPHALQPRLGALVRHHDFVGLGFGHCLLDGKQAAP